MTTVDTDKLIARLTESGEPVRPLPRPWVRTEIWLALGIPYVAVVVMMMSPRPDLAAKLTDMRFLIEQIAALLTGITAAAAAFAMIIPGYSRKILLVPAFPLSIWLGSLAQGCIQALVEFGPTSLTLEPDWICFPAIALVGTVPAVVMAVMLRRGAPLMPCTTVALGALAAAGLGNFGLRLFHPQDASVMVLVWQMGTVFVLTVLAGWAGRLLLNWRSLIGAVRRRAAIR